jgi:hypothetical protein
MGLSHLTPHQLPGSDATDWRWRRRHPKKTQRGLAKRDAEPYHPKMRKSQAPGRSTLLASRTLRRRTDAPKYALTTGSRLDQESPLVREHRQDATPRRDA